VADSGSGLQVIDISAPGSPVIAGYVGTPIHAFKVAVSGRYAYVTDFDLGIYVIDISAPGSPVIEGSACSHEVKGARGIAVSGDYVYFAAGSGFQAINKQCEN